MIESKDSTPKQSDPDIRKAIPLLLLYALLLCGFMFLLSSTAEQPLELPYSQFISELNGGTVDQLIVDEKKIAGTFIAGKNRGRHFTTVTVDPKLVETLATKKVSFRGLQEDTFWKNVAGFIGPIVLVFLFWSLLFSRGGQGMSPGMMSIERSGAKIYKEESVKVTFADVAGVDEAKEELTEVLNFLKFPDRYRKLGGHLPKGILLVGPPGTGKTLLARAVAGEAGVPFFSISGSQFVEMFVGVGAARVRDLFAEAAKSAPCIIFIDELDALGKARGNSPITGGHDEKEQTLNQLLVQLDGFDPMQGIVLLAATNRPEMLDTALLRAGRFDRHVLVDRPDKVGRVQILRVHLRNVTVDDSVDVEAIAASTPGFTGADLANLVNEAVLLAVRRNSEKVQLADFNSATERIIAGLEKKNRLLNPQERKVVAYHECGHAIVGLSLPGNDVLQKVSIIPRGVAALGYTMQRPTEDRFLMSKEELENKMAGLLGGRAAEILKFQQISTGASDDLVKATDIARSMVVRYGMNPKLGPVTYEAETGSFLQSQIREYTGQRQYSEETAREIDNAVRILVEEALQRAIAILSGRRDALDRCAQRLLEQETLTGVELTAIVGAEMPPVPLRLLPISAQRTS